MPFFLCCYLLLFWRVSIFLNLVITLGTKSNIQYQSLLPIEMLHLEFRQNPPNSNLSTNNVQKWFSEMKELVEGGEQQSYAAKNWRDEPYETQNTLKCPKEESINNEAFMYECCQSDDCQVMYIKF